MRCCACCASACAGYLLLSTGEHFLPTLTKEQKGWQIKAKMNECNLVCKCKNYIRLEEGRTKKGKKTQVWRIVMSQGLKTGWFWPDLWLDRQRPQRTTLRSARLPSSALTSLSLCSACMCACDAEIIQEEQQRRVAAYEATLVVGHTAAPLQPYPAASSLNRNDSQPIAAARPSVAAVSRSPSTPALSSTSKPTPPRARREQVVDLSQGSDDSAFVTPPSPRPRASSASSSSAGQCCAHAAYSQPQAVRSEVCADWLMLLSRAVPLCDTTAATSRSKAADPIAASNKKKRGRRASPPAEASETLDSSQETASSEKKAKPSSSKKVTAMDTETTPPTPKKGSKKKAVTEEEGGQ